jgi:CRISPR-associated protein Csb1
VVSGNITATQPDGFALPAMSELKGDLQTAIAACKAKMVVTEVTFNDELKKGKEEESLSSEEDEEAAEA